MKWKLLARRTLAIRVHIKDAHGGVTHIQAQPGNTLLKTALDAGVPIIAACEGNMQCSTCHMFIQQPFYDRIPQPTKYEEDMVELAIDYDPEKSRLACQIVLTEELDDLEAELPEEVFDYLG